MRVVFGGAEIFSYKVKVSESNGKGLRWVEEEKGYSEAADFEVPAAEGIKEGCVGKRAESAKDVGGKGSVFEVCDRRGGEVDVEGRYGC